MKPPKHPLSISHDEFDRGLRAAFLLNDQTLNTRTGAKSARSYFVRHRGRILPLKAVLRLAYIMAGKPWGYMQSASAARQLGSKFDILHITEKTERERLERQREIAERWARPQQAKFRERLLEIYQGRCAISGCTALEAIDAAHIIGVDGDGEDVDSNGLILRADLHRLFDRDLLAIDPRSGAARFHLRCASNYAGLEGQIIELPSSGPSLKQFSARWQRFTKVDEQ